MACERKFPCWPASPPPRALLLTGVKPIVVLSGDESELEQRQKRSGKIALLIEQRQNDRGIVRGITFFICIHFKVEIESTICWYT